MERSIAGRSFSRVERSRVRWSVACSGGVSRLPRGRGVAGDGVGPVGPVVGLDVLRRDGDAPAKHNPVMGSIKRAAAAALP